MKVTSRKRHGKKLHMDLDPGRKEMRRAQLQARETGTTIHRRGRRLHREPKP